MNLGRFPESGGNQVAAGPDGSVWFTKAGFNFKTNVGFLGVIGRVTPSGRVSEFPQCAPVGPHSPPIFAGGGLTAGPDGNVWFGVGALDRIGRITPKGHIELLRRRFSGIAGLASGPGGIWYYRKPSSGSVDTIGRVTAQGAVREFPLATKTNLRGIVAGPDGNIWFTGLYSVWRMTPAGVLAEFDSAGTLAPDLITTGPDGNLWFNSDGLRAPSLARITATGQVSEFSGALATKDGGPWSPVITGLAPGPDGNVWFTQQRNALSRPDLIGWITPDGQVTEIPSPIRLSSQSAIARGPDGNMWLSGYTGQLARVNLNPASRPLPAHPHIPRPSTAGCVIKRAH